MIDLMSCPTQTKKRFSIWREILIGRLRLRIKTKIKAGQF